MRTFVAGERLFAADLNDNFDETQLAANITSGTLDVARIPDLAASKITSGTLAAARLPTGTVLQVVQTVKTDTYSSAVGQGVMTDDVTGLTATITPLTATNKVLVTVDMTVGINSDDFGVSATLHRDSTPIGIADDPGSSANRATSGAIMGLGARIPSSLSFTFLDSPATTSAVAYSVRLRHDDNSTRTIFVNRNADANLGNRTSYTVSTISAIEVAA
jgi:hypothetical protein